MITMTLTVRQILGEWQLKAVLTESYGPGIPSARSTAVWQAPLTEREWSDDALGSVLSAVARWSGMTMEDGRHT
jgi:hypothetical protein